MTPAVVTKFKRCQVTDVVATALRQGVVCPSSVHSVVCFARKWSLQNCWSPWCWNKKPVVHASPVCTQTNRFFRKGLFCTHSEIGHRYEHEHVTQTTPAPKTEVQKAQEVKPEPQQSHQTMKSKVHLMFIVWAPKKLGAGLSWNNIKNSALARPM